MSAKGKNNYMIEEAIKAGMRLENGQLILASGRPYAGKPKSRDGYHVITLRRNGQSVNVNRARIVLWLSQGAPPSPQHEADHINGIRQDDRPENLRWATQAENQDNISSDERTRRAVAMRARHDEIKQLKASHAELLAALEFIQNDPAYSHLMGVTLATVQRALTKAKGSL